MHIIDKQERSVYYWLSSLLSGFNITPVDSYGEGDIVIPSVSIDMSRLTGSPLELGNRVTLKDNFWVIDIFAANKTQRNGIAYLIYDELEKKIPVYNYDEGFPPSVSPTNIGVIEPTEYKLQHIKVNPALVDKLYWRTQITFIGEYINK
jgi:hypothetical protein